MSSDFNSDGKLKNKKAEGLDGNAAYHPTYGLLLSQSKIQSLLASIQERVRLSPLVIEEIAFEHPSREDNNQLQIDSRFNKESKERKELIHKIDGFIQHDQKFKRYQGLCGKYKGAANLPNDRVKSPFEIDQAGNRKLKDSKIWRSPGKSLLLLDTFKSLNSPMSNPKSCCFASAKKQNFGHKSSSSTVRNPEARTFFVNG